MVRRADRKLLSVMPVFDGRRLLPDEKQCFTPGLHCSSHFPRGGVLMLTTSNDFQPALRRREV
ncbi:hypothetical protein PG995_009468 [Apiospora arundinis]